VHCPDAGSLTYNARMTRAAAVLVFIVYAWALAGLPLSAAANGSSGSSAADRSDSSLTANRPLRLAVAANFRSTAELLAKEFSAAHGIDVAISSAATGILAAQWRRGAPFDLMLAADRARPAALAREGLSQGESHCYAIGSLVLLGAGSEQGALASSLAPTLTSTLASALANPSLSIAIANPRSAPYGTAAIAVLEREGFAGPDARRVVMGSNVQQAYQFYASGAADLALVARSLSPGNGLAVPSDWHPAIEQHAIVNAASTQGKQANELLAFMRTPAGVRVLEQYGYQPCS
jgi:molybdate transport system substrate-binding protein